MWEQRFGREDDTATNTRIIKATPGRHLHRPRERSALARGWVGASRMRSVDDVWPHAGAQLHHSFGAWPAVIDDETTSMQWNPPHRFIQQPKRDGR